MPTVASATDAFRYAITPGETGLLAESPDDWTAALARLIDDPDARHALGDRARAETLQRYSPQERSAQLIALLEDVLDGFSSPDAAPQRVPETMARCLLRRLRALEEKRAQQDQQLVQLRQTLAGWERVTRPFSGAESSSWPRSYWPTTCARYWRLQAGR